ncbi:MAG: hypothetical protein AAF512_19770 [Pseudomonadota bacterium]
MNQASTFLPTRAPLAGQPFAEIDMQDEYLHKPYSSGHFAATETAYYGFNIPEARLNGEIYIWLHPVLKTMSSSVYIWTGNRSSTLACEYINHYHYLPFPTAGIDDYTIEPLGLAIKIIKPLQTIELKFADARRGVSFELNLDAIMPPAGRPGGFHFTQAMKTRGILDLFGTHYEIDGFFSRDRSWGQERHETARVGPPLDWMTGIFNRDFAFHVLSYEDPQRNPAWISRYGNQASAKPFVWGYVFREGGILPVSTCSSLVTRESDRLTPRVVDMYFEDSMGHQYNMRGYVNARMPWQTWQNMNVYFCQMRWECEGLIGWGDLQDIQNNDFVHHFS